MRQIYQPVSDTRQVDFTASSYLKFIECIASFAYQAGIDVALSSETLCLDLWSESTPYVLWAFICGYQDIKS